MRNIEEINETIINWNGTFDKLVKQFNNNEYNEMLNETIWEIIDDTYMDEYYTNGDWPEFLHFYLEDWIHANLIYGNRDGIENLMRLWLEF